MRRKARLVLGLCCLSLFAATACEDDPMDDDYLHTAGTSAAGAGAESGAGAGAAGTVADAAAADSGGNPDAAADTDAGEADAG